MFKDKETYYHHFFIKYFYINYRKYLIISLLFTNISKLFIDNKLLKNKSKESVFKIIIIFIDI